MRYSMYWRLSGRMHRINVRWSVPARGVNPGLCAGPVGRGLRPGRWDVRVNDLFAAAVGCAVAFVAGCAEQPAAEGGAGPATPAGALPAKTGSVVRIEAGPDAPKRAQAAICFEAVVT